MHTFHTWSCSHGSIFRSARVIGRELYRNHAITQEETKTSNYHFLFVLRSAAMTANKSNGTGMGSKYSPIVTDISGKRNELVIGCRKKNRFHHG
mmetsp:Transcript_463/g.923  ORF Transcript_463/g.923 Transcript_463/m.923 type:complete len:94 (+) Transcript_463:156-437(+)